MENYYNTTGLKGEDLNRAGQKASNQDEIILGVFKKYSKYKLTPFDISASLKGMFIDYPM